MTESTVKKTVKRYALTCGCIISKFPDKHIEVTKKCKVHSIGSFPLVRVLKQIAKLEKMKPKKIYREGYVQWGSRSSKLVVGPDGKFYQAYLIHVKIKGVGYKNLECAEYCPTRAKLKRLHFTCLTHCRIRMFLEGKIPRLDRVSPYIILHRYARPRWKKVLTKIVATIHEYLAT